MKTIYFCGAGRVAAMLLFCFRGPAADGVVRIQAESAVSNVRRFGVNLGFRSSWGAEQLMANVVMNPGFEGIVDRCLVTAIPLDTHRFLDDSKWFGRPDEFWAGAEYQIRTGRSAGRGGRIVNSKKAGTRGLPEFVTTDELPPLEPGDRITLTKLTNDRLPTQWWIPTESAGRFSISLEPRPGSPGQRSLRFEPKPKSTAEVHSYLDTIGGRAGVLLPITGKWRLSFWARARQQASLSVSFRRDGGRTWVNRTFVTSPRWQQEVVDFDGGENNSHGPLDLSFKASGELWLDDVSLSSLDSSSSAFRHEVLEVLAKLHPAYLRDWQGQLGDTLDNRLAPAEGRRASRYRPGGDEATAFGYSLPEFLDLCRQVRANPWIVVPTTFTDAEWAGLGRYLKSRSGDDRFSEIVVEFGNENWNRIFSPAGIMDPARHAEAAARGFRTLTDAGGALPIQAVVNAQFANPDSVAKLSSRLCFPALIAVAPYFLRSLSADDSPAAALSALFAGDGGTLREIAGGLRNSGHELGVYEINLHTTEGDAAVAVRTPVAAGAASGSALAIHLLDGLALGIRRQCVYVLSGFDFRLSGPLGYAPLWGIARELGSTQRLRPTGMALALLNRAVAGDLYKCRVPYRDLTVAPFRNGSVWSVAVASAAAEPREVQIEFPEIHGVRLPTRCLTLRAAGPLATNEEAELVSIAQEPIVATSHMIRMHLPGYGLAVLLPEDAHER